MWTFSRRGTGSSRSTSPARSFRGGEGMLGRRVVRGACRCFANILEEAQSPFCRNFPRRSVCGYPVYSVCRRGANLAGACRCRALFTFRTDGSGRCHIFFVAICWERLLRRGEAIFSSLLRRNFSDCELCAPWSSYAQMNHPGTQDTPRTQKKFSLQTFRVYHCGRESS